jgi:L-rhamnose 1-dehydrogenase
VCLGDVAEEGFAPRPVDFGVREFGDVDILVTKAGILGLYPFLTPSHATWRRFIDVYLSGAFYCGQSPAPADTYAGSG